MLQLKFDQSLRIFGSMGGSYLAGWICLTAIGCSGASKSEPQAAEPHPTAAVEAEVRVFCGACHVVPQPEMFPKSQWYAEVRRGYEFYFQSDLHELNVPIQEDVVQYFRERAPVELEFNESQISTPSPLEFRVQPFEINTQNQQPAISFVAWTTLPEGPAQLRLSDMRSGDIGFFDVSTAFYKPIKTASSNPAVTRLCDLDGNGHSDMVIAELGSFLPADHHHGKVLWIPDVLVNGERKPTAILDNIGRVADVCVADFDGDGDEDLVVAEFGWHRTGGIHVLWNEETGENNRQFRDELIDPRPGAIHVPTVDLNGDGRMDFVGLLSQEFESVVAYLNLPDGFQKQIVYAAPDPSVGSSGIELIDVDRDGDLDVLYTNGDTFDSHSLKPCHGIKWLENVGTFPFKVHHIAAMGGVNRARAADLDGDGDFDIVASALVPQRLFERGSRIVETLVWFEQTGTGTFERHVLQTGPPAHATLEVADLDDDGDIDFVVGCFQDEVEAVHPALIVYWNDGKIRP